jgi:tetratricopeptide (TPR) repeat protein
MVEYRVIIAGQLEFGSQRAFDQVRDQYAHRMEHYYKNDILLKPEAIFQDDELTLDVPRTVLISTERLWLNTLNLLERVVTFSIAGSLNLWRLSTGVVIDHHKLEPKSDRTTVQLFNKGRELVDQRDQEQAALKMMTKVVGRFERHAQAYERRGLVNFRLGNVKDAIYDYTKSISINPLMPESYYGRGLAYVQEDQMEAAAADFEAVTKNSIPHQSIYWKAQVALGDAYLALDRPPDAMRVFGMFAKRKQRIASLERYDRRVAFQLGKLYLTADRPRDAITAFEAALSAPADRKAPSESEIERHLSQASGKNGNPSSS